MYEFDKELKDDFSFIEGAESHLRRRKMILQRHPEVAKLLEVDKPYSIILAFIVITLGLTVTYFVKVLSLKFRTLHGLYTLQFFTLSEELMDILSIALFTTLSISVDTKT